MADTIRCKRAEIAAGRGDSAAGLDNATLAALVEAMTVVCELMKERNRLGIELDAIDRRTQAAAAYCAANRLTTKRRREP